jgi:hypothetical protein
LIDGTINILDYVRIDQGLAAGLNGWSNGDFNYDGAINILDYATVIDSNLGNQNGYVFPSAGGLIATPITPLITNDPLALPVTDYSRMNDASRNSIDASDILVEREDNALPPTRMERL